MSAGLIGALTGLAAALLGAAFLRALARRVELEETRRVLNVTALVELALFPVVGWLVGAQFAGE